MYLRCFCGNGFMFFFVLIVWVQWDCLRIPRSVITLDLGLEFGIRLDTILIHNCSRKKACSWFFTDFLGLWVGGRKAKTGLLYTGFAIKVSIVWQNITLFKGLKERIKVCCGVFFFHDSKSLSPGVILALEHGRCWPNLPSKTHSLLHPEATQTWGFNEEKWGSKPCF